MAMTLPQENALRWAHMQVGAAAQPLAMKEAKALVAAKPHYIGFGSIPWWVVAVIHEREASQSWAASLAQGDAWNRVSIHVPKGIGPFSSWAEAASYALNHCAPFAAKWTDWSIGGALSLLERYNGLGYAYRGLASPYIWAGTDQYRSGKFIADGHFDPNAVDKQIGCAALLNEMARLDPSAGVSK